MMLKTPPCSVFAMNKRPIDQLTTRKRIVTIDPFIFKQSPYDMSVSRRLRPSVVECLMLLVVTPSDEGDVKNAGMTRADAIDAKTTAMRMVMRILAVVCDVAYLFQKVDFVSREICWYRLLVWRLVVWHRIGI